MASDFAGAFAALREILRRHSEGMVVKADTPSEFSLETRAIGPNGQRMWFGCVQWKKSAVTYHLMPLYFNPMLQAAVPAELLARKQGKTCFNFREPDDALFAEIDELTRMGREQWERAGFLQEGELSREKMEAAVRAGGEDPARIARLRTARGKAAASKRAATMRKRPDQGRSEVLRLSPAIFGLWPDSISESGSLPPPAWG